MSPASRNSRTEALVQRADEIRRDVMAAADKLARLTEELQQVLAEARENNNDRPG